MTLKEFRDLTEGRPEDSEIRIESYYAQGTSGTSPVAQGVGLRLEAPLQDGEQVLHVAHTKKTGPTS